jgi:hypothetical protein
VFNEESRVRSSVNLSRVFHAYGLTVASAMPCPELRPGHGIADVTIRLGEVPVHLQRVDDGGVLYQANADQFLLRLPDIAAYLVQNGNEIVIERAPGATDGEVRLFLLGSCLGALLHQRGFLVLHAGAIRSEKGAVLFAGPSGNGKSTLLGAMLQRGYRMLSDDITALVLDAADRPTVLPGYPQTKLWADSADTLAQSTERLRRVRPDLDKFAQLTHDSFCDEPTPLHAIYTLTTHNDPDGGIRIDPIKGSGCFDAVRHNTYRERFLDGLGMRPHHFRLAAAVANRARFARVTRPRAPFLLDELADRIEEDLAR